MCPRLHRGLAFKLEQDDVVLARMLPQPLHPHERRLPHVVFDRWEFQRCILHLRRCSGYKAFMTDRPGDTMAATSSYQLDAPFHAKPLVCSVP